MPDASCTLAATAAGLRATFDAPQWAPTPGQYLVLYDGDVCLGGAVISAPDAETARLSEQTRTAAVPG
jgi:tRNA-specific 2-thiouridylase